VYDGSASGALYLDTPRQITDTAGNVVWAWDNSDPFGNNMPNENPSGQGTFTNNLGYPGQYRDRETNTFYNFYRDCYDPATGRYCQSDPTGLAGGINTYTYVDGNPLIYIDPLGLDWILVNGGTSGTATYYNSAGQALLNMPFNSGYGKNQNDPTVTGQGRTPDGRYEITQPTHPRDDSDSFCDEKGNCWSVPMDPQFKTPNDRCPSSEPCSIHPDGGSPGTAGCTGLTDKDTKKFKDLIDKAKPTKKNPITVIILNSTGPKTPH
jgi:RHS repeat-associated protein